MKKNVAFKLLLISIVVLLGLTGCTTNQPQSAPESAPETNGTEEPAPQIKDDYPNKPITIIVPSNPGGNYDNLARVIVSSGTEHFGVPLVIKNVPGGMFTIGMQETLDATADGYTLMVSSESANAYGTHFVDTRFKTEDVKFIAGMSAIRHTFSAKSDLPFDTLEELLAYVKDHPNELTLGSSSPIYECWLLALKEHGYEFQMVSFPTGTATGTALAGGHVDTAIFGLAGAKPLYEAGTIKILAMGDDLGGVEGVPSIQDTPWIADIIGELAVGSGMVMGSPDIPEERVKFIEEALRKTYEENSFQGMALKLGLDPIWKGTEEITEHILSVDKYVYELTEKAQIVKEAQ